MAIAFGNSTSGNLSSDTPTINLPTRSASDTILLFISRNQVTTSFTGDSNATVTDLTGGGGRLECLLVEPVDTVVSSFVLTTTVAAINGYYCVAVADVADVQGTTTYHGTDSTSAVPQTPHTLDYTLDGTNEVVLSIAATNSSASWTTSGNTLYNTTGGNATLIIEQDTPVEGETRVTGSAMDRGLSGSARGEASGTIVLTSGITNYALTGGFEYDTNTDGLADDWAEEHDTVTAATYSLSTSYNTNGTYSQRMQYTGEGTNTGAEKVEYYSYVDDVFTAGQGCQFSISLAGACSNCTITIALEAHQQGVGYIAEQSEVIPAGSITTTPTEYTVEYGTLPANTDRVVFAVLANELTTSAAVDLYGDGAKLQTYTAPVSSASSLPSLPSLGSMDRRDWYQ